MEITKANFSEIPKSYFDRPNRALYYKLEKRRIDFDIDFYNRTGIKAGALHWFIICQHKNLPDIEQMYSNYTSKYRDLFDYKIECPVDAPIWYYDDYETYTGEPPIFTDFTYLMEYM
jgi:hypothetical protein